MIAVDLEKKNNVYISPTTSANSAFEELYIALRKKEERIYNDDELKLLPQINSSHPHSNEWQVRKKSTEKLLKYLEAKKTALKILEVGCGNGWLSNQLSTIKEATVIGLDINLTELQQAARVFKNLNLSFVYGDLRSGLFISDKFDIIVFAASIQYFPFVDEILNCAMQNLKPGGEIHILDSHFYKKNKINQARERTYEYYAALGFPEMADHYFHHGIYELKPYDHKKLFNPLSFKNRIIKNRNSFAWICITKS